MKTIADFEGMSEEEINGLIREGRYRDLQHFAVTAINILLAIERSRSSATLAQQGVEGISALKLEPNEYKQMAFPLADLQSENLLNPAPPMLFGQISRILPSKMLARAFITEFVDKPSVVLQQFMEKAICLAEAFGRHLRDLDDKAMRRRGYQISTGFPLATKASDREKALRRFGKNFIAYVRHGGKISGALVEERLAFVQNINNEQHIGLTQAGWNFALLPNPIMDGLPESVTTDLAFSEDEIQFYLDHCRERLTGEFNAMRGMIRCLGPTGAGTHEIDIYMREVLDLPAEEELTQSKQNYLNTMRSGLLSRMYELNLLSKVREGRTVRYGVTEFALGVFKNFDSEV